MIAPLYEYGIISDSVGLASGVLIGIAFGFALERAGLGYAPKLAAQFYLRDLTVLKVMFTAIVTAMTGVFFLSRLGLLDISQVYLPETFLAPQLVGGLVFGAGFVVAGLCPGTSCVAAATGRADGIASVLGMFAGVLATGLVFPLLRSFYDSTPLGSVTLAGQLGVSYGTIVFAVTYVAIALFFASEWIERTRARRAREVHP